ncbi:10523_t:CDS:1, partial [Racocetra fulgida]
MANIDGDNNKKKQTTLFLSRLNGESEFLSPTYTPNISYISKWSDQLNYLKLRKEQTQINLEWEEFYFRIYHAKALYKEIS